MSGKSERIYYRLGAAVALAAAFLQVWMNLAVATAPSTAREAPMGAIGVLLLSGLFTALWLISAALFHRSARHEAPEGTGVKISSSAATTSADARRS